MMRIHSAVNNINRKSVITRMLIGAILGLGLISLYVFSVKNSNPEWGKLWMIRPLVIVPLAAAAGSLFFSSIDLLRSQSSWKKILLLILSTFAFIVALWVRLS